MTERNESEELNESNEVEITSDNNINVIVDTEKPKSFWQKLKHIWSKTIFARKIEENSWKRELMEEVKQESKEDMKQILKEQYLQQQKDKLSGKAKKGGIMGALEKVGKALAEEGKGMGIGNGKYDDKISKMLGTNNNNNQKDYGNTMGS